MTARAWRLGTRGSALARSQSSQVARQLEAATGRPVELVIIHSQGDQDRSTPLDQLGGVGVFTVAIRQALRDGACDVVVHSLKDLPTEVAPDLVLVTPPREDCRDALCSRDGRGLDDLPRGARVGTGSPRRAAQLRALRPDLDVVGLRGNVDTRLARVFGPVADIDAVVLAVAGLTRLGRTDAIAHALDPALMMPAPGQGALAVEARGDAVAADADLAAALAALHDPATGWAVTAERAVLRRLGAGCSAPLGAWARIEEGHLLLSAVVMGLDGRDELRADGDMSLEGATAGDVVELGALGRGGDADVDTTVAAGIGLPSPTDEDESDELLVAEMLGHDVAEALLEAGAAEITGLAGPAAGFRERPA